MIGRKTGDGNMNATGECERIGLLRRCDPILLETYEYKSIDVDTAPTPVFDFRQGRVGRGLIAPPLPILIGFSS